MKEELAPVVTGVAVGVAVAVPIVLISNALDRLSAKRAYDLVSKKISEDREKNQDKN